MNIDDEAVIDCPHCGATTSIDLASIAIGEERLIVDCAVCCHPLRVETWLDDNEEIQMKVDWDH